MKMKETFDYKAEQSRRMCAGCNKFLELGKDHRCLFYNSIPKMYLAANQCPHNYRRVRIDDGKVRQGQQKQGGKP